MRLFRITCLIGAAILPFAAQAQQAVKPIDFTIRTLANGLTVYAIRDTGTSNVAVQVWYNVGSKDDPAGRSGFAHMFEHLMFKATRNLAPEQMDRLTEDVGGYNNASTNDDYTNYYEVVPANHLQPLLFAEADRMASLVVEPKGFASERDVVKEELRQRTLAQPYGKLFSIYYPEISYVRHPYARPGIGSLAELESASIDDVRAFHATYYRPDNAILVVSGNFDPKQLDAWVDRYFAGIARPDRPIPRVTVEEPERLKATHVTVYEPNTPLPAVLISYPLPPDRHPDSPALSVLNAILAIGESSRLYETLVYRDQIAQTAETFIDSKQSTGNLAVYAIVAGGKTAAAAETALRREVARMRDALVTPAELAEAKNQILTAALQARETAEGKASTIATSAIIDGDPRASDRQLAAIAAVTGADIQRVARLYLRDERSAAIHYLPIEDAPKGAVNKVAIADTVQAAPLVVPDKIAIVTPAAEADRIAPPAAGAPIAAAVPAPSEVTLANGLRVIVVEKHDLPLLTVSLVAPGGGAADPADRAGLGSFAAGLLTKGTKTRSATRIAAEIEALGGSIDSDADWDGASIDITVKADQAKPALAILADVARNPAFAPEEIERARAQTIDDVSVTLKDPAKLAGLVASRAVFGTAPYGHVLSGTPASLKAIGAADIAAAYRATWRPDQAALVLVGDITPAVTKALAEANFDDWKAPAASPASVATPASYPVPRVIVVDMPDAGQAGVVIARPGITRRDPLFYPASVANTILGGGYSSRLNQEIRIKRGLAYGAGSALTARRLPGSVSARTQTKNPSAAEAVSIMIAEMKRLGDRPVAASELETRKAVLIGNFGRATETTDDIADMLGDYVVQNVPLSELARFTPSVAAVDPDAVQAAAAKLLDPGQASIVVVGDAKLFVDALREAYPKLELIPVAALKLDKVGLR
ncbi:MAG: peptidase [Rhizorhabdus sp.]|nr:peptidase [Rhizorhabdus sp.]